MDGTRTETRPVMYAAGMFGTSVPINLFKTYAAAFYVDKLGLPVERFAFILFIDAFIDAVDNWLYGYLSDRTRTRWGRRRPWILPGAVFYAAALAAFFNPPFTGADRALMVYCFVFYIGVKTLDSLVGTSYGALFPDLFRSEERRAVTNAFRQVFQFMAMVIGIALTPVVTGKIGYGATGIIYGLTGAAFIIFSNLNCHEKIEEIRVLEKPRFIPSIISIFKNSKFWLSGFTGVFYSAAMSLLLAAMPFYAKYTLKISGFQTTILFGEVLILAVIFVPVWTRFINKYTVLPVWRAALLLLCVSYIPLFFAGSLVTAALGSVLLGIGYSGVVTTFDLVGAKIIDDDRERHGVRREGIFTSVSGFMNRLYGLFVSLAFLFAKTFYGYESGDKPGPNPGGAAKFLLTVFPFSLMIVSVIISRFLRFKKTSE